MHTFRRFVRRLSSLGDVCGFLWKVRSRKFPIVVDANLSCWLRLCCSPHCKHKQEISNESMNEPIKSRYKCAKLRINLTARLSLICSSVFEAGSRFHKEPAVTKEWPARNRSTSRAKNQTTCEEARVNQGTLRQREPASTMLEQIKVNQGCNERGTPLSGIGSRCFGWSEVFLGFVYWNGCTFQSYSFVFRSGILYLNNRSHKSHSH